MLGAKKIDDPGASTATFRSESEDSSERDAAADDHRTRKG